MKTKLFVLLKVWTRTYYCILFGRAPEQGTTSGMANQEYHHYLSYREGQITPKSNSCRVTKCQLENEGRHFYAGSTITKRGKDHQTRLNACHHPLKLREPRIYCTLHSQFLLNPHDAVRDFFSLRQFTQSFVPNEYSCRAKEDNM